MEIPCAPTVSGANGVRAPIRTSLTWRKSGGQLKTAPLGSCWSIHRDRLARDPLQLAVIGEEREAADVQLQFVEGPSGDFAEDQLVRNIPGYIGEKERVQIPD